MQAGVLDVKRAVGAGGPFPWEGEEHGIAHPVRRRGGADRSLGNGAGGGSTADPTEIVAVEEIGLSILAQRQQERTRPTTPWHFERQRFGATKVSVCSVEPPPVVRGAVVWRSICSLQVEA